MTDAGSTPRRIEPGTEAYWRERLTSEQFRVCVTKGTERPFSGAFHEAAPHPGTYHCICCQAPLFRSSAQFNSGCGWPSYFEPVTADSVRYQGDRTLARARTEVLCGVCNAHLGHVFDDGPPPTGKRYCINSVCLQLDPAPSAELPDP